MYLAIKNIFKHKKRRWSDNDKQWWIFTYSLESNFPILGVVLDSGEPEYPGCSVRFKGFGHTFIIDLPQWVLTPFQQWVDTSRYEWSRDSDGYWDMHRREFGFTVHNGHLSIMYGPQTGDSSTTKQWGYFLPWQNWRHVRFSLYDLEGNEFWTEMKKKGTKGAPISYDDQHKAESLCPKMSFKFLDYDGEEIVAKTHIEEREWRFGEKWCKWLSLFRKPKIRRSLDIDFSKETGPEKGSWKGGTVGHGIDLLPGELHESAFIRYCDKHNMTFIGDNVTAMGRGY